jgi:hypothetical protein
MGSEMSFNVGSAQRAEGAKFEGSPEDLKKNKVSYLFLISLGLWTIFCFLGTWTFIYRHHFFFAEEAIFLTYVYTFCWALLIWVIPAIAFLLLYLIFSK